MRTETGVIHRKNPKQRKLKRNAGVISFINADSDKQEEGENA